jgi:hypothetical protein
MRREIEHRRLKLLKARTISFEVQSEQEKESALVRFIKEFIDGKRRESLMLNLHRTRTRQKPVDYHKYLSSRCTLLELPLKDGSQHEGLVRWLQTGQKSAQCWLFWSEPWNPAFLIDFRSLSNNNFYFFPDSYWVNFGAGRMLIQTRDGQTLLGEISRRAG